MCDKSYCANWSKCRFVYWRATPAVECSLHEINQVNLGQLDEKSMQLIQFVSVGCLKSKCIYFGAKVLALPLSFRGGIPVPGSTFLTDFPPNYAPNLLTYHLLQVPPAVTVGPKHY